MHDLSFIKESNLFVLRFHGTLTTAEGKAAFLEVVRHAEFNDAARLIMDTRGVTEARLDFAGLFAGVQSVLREIGRFGPSALGVVLVRGETHFGLARMLEQVVEALAHRHIRVVTSVEDAAAQLDMPPALLDGILATAGRPLPGGTAQG